MTDTPLFCHRCGTRLQHGQGQFYVVRIEAFADPSPPEFSSQDLERDFEAEIQRLVESAARFSEQELLDQIYRKLTLYLCTPCYRVWIEDPAK